MFHCQRRPQFPVNADLKGFSSKQLLIAKFSIFLFALILAAFTGYLSGMLGGAYFAPTLFSEKQIEGIWLGICMTLVILTWSFEVKRSGIGNSFFKAGIVVVGFSFLAVLTIPIKDSFLVTLVASSGFLVGYVVAFLTASFSISLTSSLLTHKQYTACKSIYIFCITSLSLLMSHLFGIGSPVYKSQHISIYFNAVSLLAGLAISSLVIKLSFDIGDINRKPRKSFEFLRYFAINLCTLGSISFYDLDLSGADLTGANVANTDFRVAKFYRTCLRDVKGLDRARVDNRYFDLDLPKVQVLLTQGCCYTRDFVGINLQGAYLRSASDMREFNLTDAKLDGADLQEADLRGSTFLRTQLPESELQRADLRRANFTDANLTAASLRAADLRDSIFVRAQVARVDFTGADLTGACIEDWSVSSKTTFTDARCDYVFRKYENGQSSRRYPSDRNFEPGEFAALFQQPENELELIFKGDFSYNALSLAFYKLKTEKPELDLELKGIEQRGKLWVVRVTSSNPMVEARLEQAFSEVYQTTKNSDSVETTIKDSIYRDYEDIKQRLAESQQLVRQFAGISESQAEALKQLSKQALGTNFYIEGSNITNLTGQGQIEYTEAAGQIRSLVTQPGTENQIFQGSQQVLAQLQDIATTPLMQTELIQQILLREAESDPAFRHFLLQQQQQILTVLPPGAIAAALQNAISQLSTP